jgi:hypothetical protein
VAFLVVLINVGAVAATNGHLVAIISLVGAIWSWGVARNFSRDPEDMPNYTVFLTLGTGVAGIVMSIVGLIS